MKSLGRFSVSDLLSSHVPSSSNTASGDAVLPQTDIESLLKKAMQHLKAEKCFLIV